jgi:pimeloyl-ACP methyl ester carboxylesterase
MPVVETPVGAVAYRRAGAGQPLLLLHGGLSDSRSWMPQLDSLAASFDVVAWDCPGCGDSADPTRPLSLADYADAAAALVENLDLGPVHLGGHSFGSSVAIEAWARHPHLVRSLVLSGAYAGWRGSLPDAEVASRREGLLAALREPPSVWVDNYLASFFSGPVSAETLATVRTMMLEVRPAAASMVTALAAADLRPVLPTIAVPTLLISGRDDVRSPRAVGEALHAAIHGSTRVLVPGGHDVNLESSAAYDAAVLDFLT